MSQKPVTPSVERRNGAVVLRLQGTLDSSSVPLLDLERLGLPDDYEALLVDMSLVEYVDADGTEALVRLYRKVRRSGRAFALCCLQRFPRLVLELLRLNLEMPIFGSVEEAVQALNEGSLL